MESQENTELKIIQNDFENEELGDDSTFYQIYKITNKVNGKIYIGMTKQGLKKRWDGHIGRVYCKIKKKYYLHNAIIKHGEKNFSIEEIDNCVGFKNANELEMKHVALNSSNNKDVGYNLTKGGDGARGMVYSEKQKEEMSRRAKERLINNPNSIRKLREGLDKYVLENGHPWIGRNHNDETKQKIAESKYVYNKDDILNCVVENKCLTVQECAKKFEVEPWYWSKIVARYKLKKEVKELINKNIEEFIVANFDLERVTHIINKNSSSTEICEELNVNFDVWTAILRHYDLKDEYNRYLSRMRYKLHGRPDRKRKNKATPSEIAPDHIV